MVLSTSSKCGQVAITHWLKQYNLREVQYMAGHRYVSSTEAYPVNNMEDLRADIDQFYPF